MLLALEYGISSDKAEAIGEASILHDIGKIGIPDNILNKPIKLCNEEFDVICNHPNAGASILGLATDSHMEDAILIAKFHHEKWNGTGYPDGLKGEDIPLPARIVALVDVYDALTERASLQKGMV